jgi:HD-GYP domain-containing protein (c-di-GMP phosphodiesterase class II)
MNMFRPIPIDVIQINEKSVVDLFIKHDDRFMLFLGKGGLFTKNHLVELNRFNMTNIYIRNKDSCAFEEYVHAYSEVILTDPTVPFKVKRATFYVSSVNALRKAMIDPNSERLDQIKNTIKPLFKNIMNNKVLLKDLFSVADHDFNTYMHSINVGIYATALAIHFFEGDSTIDMESLKRQSYGYFLHDIGKCMLNPSVIKKKGKLSQEDWAIMKKHPEWGYSILMETGYLTDEAAYISMQHHERPDGSGYPFGTKDIHPCARICAIADIFDALISARPYKLPMKPLDAIEIIKKEVYNEFDRSLVDTFIRMLGLQEEQPQLSQVVNG